MQWENVHVRVEKYVVSTRTTNVMCVCFAKYRALLESHRHIYGDELENRTVSHGSFTCAMSVQ